MFPWNLFPFNKEMKQLKPGEIEKYVQDMMDKLVPEHMRNTMNTHQQSNNHASSHADGTAAEPSKRIKTDVFETHDHIYVRIWISDNIWLKQIRLYYTTNRLIIENIPKMNDKYSVTLPAIVKKKGAAAQYKDDILEVKIPKNIDFQFSEIEITEEY
ncbi:Hsp20/alpha crystallin family protein [Bacillaceae bacterium Marseille-Q3522]|nr:Hsp20/alpha crystallin family protein [Bacillaceae bacterium Marseille-Q3522]